MIIPDTIVQAWLKEFDRIAKEQYDPKKAHGLSLITYNEAQVNVDEFLKLKASEMNQANLIQPAHE